MAKKTTKESKEFDIPTECENCVVKITPITTDFGREDLNLLRDKLNEIISKL